MTVSIAIATFNRAGEVEKTLQGLLRLDTSDCPDHEILLVDNKSTDHTRAVADRLSPYFGGRLRYVREEKQGLSHARNRALDEARYDVVAYLDDDVDVHPEWLRALCGAYSSGDIAAVGGRAYLVYSVAKPKWLAEPFVALLTRVELGRERRPAGPGELFGVNLSIRRDWLRRAGGFRTDLGRVGTSLAGCEDDEMLERIAALGGKILYEPDAVVGHRVPPGRLQRSWFWNRCLWGSASAPATWPESRVSGYELARTGWHMLVMAHRTARAAIRHGPRSAACFEQVLNVAHRTGTFIGLIKRLWRWGRLWLNGTGPQDSKLPAPHRQLTEA